MAFNVAAILGVKVTADVRDAERGLDRVDQRVRGLPSIVEKATASIGRASQVLGGIGLAGMGVQTVASAFSGLGKAIGIDFNAKLQQAEIGFTTMLGSGEKAKAFLTDLQSFAAKTPFGTRIAHGLYTAGLISAVLGTRLPGPGAVYVSQSLNFRAPVRIGDTVDVVVEVAELAPERRRARLACTCSVAGEVVLDGEAVVKVPTRESADRLRLG